MIKKYKIILFDFDGTIADTSPGIYKSILYARDKMGFDLDTEGEWYRKFIGPSLNYSFSSFCGLKGEAVDRAIDLFRERYASQGIFECNIYDGMKNVLLTLRNNDFYVGIASSKPEAFICEILDRNGCLDYFDAISGVTFQNEQVKKSDLIRKVFEDIKNKESLNIDINPYDVVMIGDRFYDAQGAREVNADFIGAGFGFGNKDEFEQYGFSQIADNAGDILKYIFKNT